MKVRTKIQNARDPGAEQEAMYRFPYHWFPECKLKWFERQEKQYLVFNLIRSHAPDPVRNYLDVGAGDGRWTSDIHDHLCSPSPTIGIDTSKRAISFAKLISPQINFLVGRGEALPFPSNCFDLVTAIEILEHVEDHSISRLLTSLRRVLRPEGLLILTTPTWNLPLTRHHFRHYSLQEVSELLHINGFEIVAAKGQALPCYGIKRNLRNLMREFPFLWKFWKPWYRETTPMKSLNLIMACRPESATT